MNKKFTTEEFIKKSKEIHGDKYDYSLVEYKSDKIKVNIICPDHGIIKQSPNVHYKHGCKKCADFNKKLTLEDFIIRANIKHNNKYDYSLVEYKDADSIIKIICPVHGIFEQIANSHYNKGYGCIKCSNSDPKNTNDFIKKAKEFHGNKYDYSLVNYKNAHSNVKIICPEHGVFIQRASSHYTNGCSKCKFSKGEKEIEKILKKFNIKYESQKKFENCKNKFELPFDFYLIDYNMCIEYDGIQHFKPVKYWGGQKQFQIILENDNIKNCFCQENNIQLLRIKYTNYKNIEDIILKFLEF